MKKGNVAKVDKMLVVSAAIFVTVFGIIIYQVLFGGAGSDIGKNLPEFEKEEKVPVQVEAQGVFKGMFGEQFVDITVDDKKLMFTYEESLKETMDTLKKDDFIEFVYLNDENEKEKRIVSIEILDEAPEGKVEEPVEEPVDKEAMLSSIYTKVKVVDGEKNKRVDFEIYNDGEMEQTLYFPTGQQYELVVRNEVGDAVYSYSKNYSISQSPSELSIDRAGKHVFSTELKPLKDGIYTLEVWLLSQNTEQLKITQELVQGKGKTKGEKEISYQTENGLVTADAKEMAFDGDKKWYVIEGVSFSGSKLSTENYNTTISLAQKQTVQEERWAAAEVLKKEGTMLEKNNLLETDEFVFFVEKDNGVVREIAVKNINGQLYKFETTYNTSWIDSRNEIEAMVQTIQ